MAGDGADGDAGRFAGPNEPWSGGALLFLVWLLGFLGTMTYSALAWVRGPCVPLPSLACMWDSTMAAIFSIVWPVYWAVKATGLFF